ncbi:Tyrosine kinase [Handroanthus impetiginosus]|uniref:Tyrosine kinase n=1 Tax=Handroanthus impetiginosus TaxID=429701 RepID=A0A2G9FWS7_9LAMI|nr:Tyrosine kinase [Handroanthus impetiginosus]
MHYNNHDVIKLLEKHGAKHLTAPMHVQNVREVPEYEIGPRELDFTSSVEITKGTYRIASWRGTKVAVKTFWEGLTDEDKLRAFRDELALLQKARHPNVVQFLGAVTQSSPMMIVTEYLPKGDLHEYLKRKGALKPATALRFAMDIARGMNYLHENKPEAIIHRDLEPSNILLDDSGHLKVADFGVSKLLKVANRIKEDKPLTYHDTSCRYLAPEVFRNEEYDTKVDVFSFALILQEMIEGCPPFHSKQDHEVPKCYAAKERPPFKAPTKFYARGLKQLIEECWSENPADRPTFKQIIPRLEAIYNRFGHRRRWKVMRPLKCFHNLEWMKDGSSLGSQSHYS